MISMALRRFGGGPLSCLRGAAVVFLTLALLLPLGQAAASSMNPLPHAFYGALLINDAPAPTGTVVTARVEGQVCGSIATVYPGKYGSDELGYFGPGIQKLIVQGEDLSNGDKVEFYIGAVKADQTYPYEVGGTTMLGLTCTAPELELKIDSTAGGTVTTPGEGTFYRFSGTVCDLLAAAEPGWHFDRWTGDVDTIANRFSAATTITVNSNCTIQAKFVTDWDVNGDGCISVLDVILVGQHWGQTGAPFWIPQDVNKDGVISVLDVILIGQHWAEGCGS